MSIFNFVPRTAKFAASTVHGIIMITRTIIMGRGVCLPQQSPAGGGVVSADISQSSGPSCGPHRTGLWAHMGSPPRQFWAGRLGTGLDTREEEEEEFIQNRTRGGGGGGRRKVI